MSVKEILFWFFIVCIAFVVGYYCGTRDTADKYEPIMDQARQSVNGIVARSVVTERGLTEAIDEVNRITDRSKRIIVLIDTIKATAGQLRDIVEAGTEATKVLGDYGGD